ncbi:PEPxxWA-CTERM sorting domain-containing protein [Sandaracinobacter neustonicus]|uniref:PEPxxWA-CTERM sorting domain-containing protein n=1 Tax=Sandaracinobacter neustonicus TaxID=1715348 RepID=UPI001F16DB72|nr:PEPxxWA-CTERM sorting domain-containing protein [Sandaracinobacter neustonicus]
MKTIFYFALAAASFATTPALAASVVDQAAYLPQDPGYLPAASTLRRNGNYERWQAMSVTAGISGQLTRVDLQVAHVVGDADLVLRIGHGEVTDSGWTSAGSISTSYLLVPTVAQANDGDYLSVDVSSLGFFQTAGETFSLLLSIGPSNYNNTYNWTFGMTNDGGVTSTYIDYPGGVNRLSEDHGLSWTQAAADRGFRTWVDAGAVPEPASWALMIAGFGIVGAAARRRRAAAQV